MSTVISLVGPIPIMLIETATRLIGFLPPKEGPKRKEERLAIRVAIFPPVRK